MKPISIQSKLVKLLRKVLLGTIVIFMIFSAGLGLFSMITISKDIKGRYEQELISKGELLVENNIIALAKIVEEEAVSSVSELVKQTVHKDKDIVYGMFQDEHGKVWVHSVKPGARLIFTEHNENDAGLRAWAENLKYPAHKRFTINSRIFVEFAAPMFIKGKRAGTIRYGLNTGSIDLAMNFYKRSLTKITLVFILGLLVFSLITFFIASNASIKQAASLTEPIKKLTKSASTISDGNLMVPIDKTSNDEIGELSENLESMRMTIFNYTSNLENMVEERTKELKMAQSELVDKAHKSGMADIATSTLHNVGNLLNSISTSSDLIREQFDSSCIHNLLKANTLLEDNMDNLQSFISQDPKGPKLMKYYIKIGQEFINEQENISYNISRLNDKIQAVADVISAQQAYAKESAMTESLNLADIVEDALTMQTGTTERYNIILNKEYQAVPRILGQKTKLVHVIINIIKNAKDAMLEVPSSQRKLTVKISRKELHVELRIEDTGVGIPPEDLLKIFVHGYTTKSDGHGFGLHSCANYIREMNGEIRAHSDGQGQGTAFILSFPMSTEENTSTTKGNA